MKKYAGRVAYSYLRYSSDPQGAGDSVRRQDTGADLWCKRNGARLDADRRMIDRGLSAYTGAHLRSGALGVFLAEVLAGRIAEGSILIVDNLDRLSRENPWDAIPVLCSLVNAGITVVALSPAEIVYDREGDNLAGLVLAVVESVRSHNESKTKARNLGAAWANKKSHARETGDAITRQVPQWLEVDGARFSPIADRVETVRRMFELAIEGAGLKTIRNRLEAEGRRSWGRSGNWSKGYLHLILTGRAVLGEYQPHGVGEARRGAKPKREKDGEAIPDYYPAVIDATTWDRAQAAIAARKDGGRPRGGQVGGVPDLFRGLLRDAGLDCPMMSIEHTRGKKGARYKVRMIGPVTGNEGRTENVSFNYRIFEAAILDRLKEVKAAEVLGAELAGEAAAIAGELARKEARLAKIAAELRGDDGDVAELAAAAREHRRDVEALKKKLHEARGREANPRAEALAEVQTLADLAADPASRLPLRTALRHVIESIDVLIIRRRPDCLVAVQVNFAGDGGRRRSYSIYYREAANGRKERWTVEDNTDKHAADLRDPRKVAKVRRDLELILERLAPAAKPVAA